MLPLVGLMLFLIFHKRKLPKRTINKLNKVRDSYDYDDDSNFKQLETKNKLIATQALSLCNTANTHLYKNSKLTYFAVFFMLDKNYL